MSIATFPQPLVITLGEDLVLSTVVRAIDPESGAATPTDDSSIRLRITAPSGDEADLNLTNEGVISGGQGRYHSSYEPAELGIWRWRWDTTQEVQGASEGTFEVISEYFPTATDPRDIRVMVPRVRRAVEGVVRAKWILTDDEVKDLVGDAIADIILYTGESAGGFGVLFGSQLLVTRRDRNGAPIEYVTSDPLGLETQSVIASQAALNYFFHRFSGVKMTETIADEASHWSYALSPSLLTAQLKLLQEQRDKALEALETEEGVLESYHSFVAVRDVMTSRFIEPWVYGHPEGYGVGAGGLEGDFRFDEIATGGGDYQLGNAGMP